MTPSPRLLSIIAITATISISSASAAFAQWATVAPGVQYQEFQSGSIDVHAVRVDLTSDAIRVIGSRESDKGLKVSDFARKTGAIVAINGDYFDEKFNPIGLTVGPCGEWKSATRTKREGYVALTNDGDARIVRQSDTTTTEHATDSVASTVSGWPALVVDCQPLSSSSLPGSDAFTRSPHPRTAVGLSRDGRTMFLVVADGRRTGVPGMTLSQLADFMANTLHACSAINFDGGGSSAMWVGDHLVNRPSDGVERRVGDHLAIVSSKALPTCESDRAMTSNSDADTTVTTKSRTETVIRTVTQSAPAPPAPSSQSTPQNPPPAQAPPPPM